MARSGKTQNTMLAEFKARGVKKPSDEAWRLLGVKFPPLPALQPDLDPKPEPGPEPKPEPKPEQDEEVLIERVRAPVRYGPDSGHRLGLREPAKPEGNARERADPWGLVFVDLGPGGTQ